ncbi:MAG TPA: primosomal protein N' [Candidatus Binataceae bacterium]|nr:primosomal protein N' [Candidatus Binataceae bacterium]
MLVRIVVVGAVRGVELLTYSVPPELEGRVRPGHRVLAPLQTRKVTGVVLEAAASFPGVEGNLKPILELLEPQPLFDRPHLQMMEFLANYYMVSPAEVFRSVIPAVARVESRRMYKLAQRPDPLRQAALTEDERRIVETLAKRPADSRRLARLGASSALAALLAEGIVEPIDSTRGRHRNQSDPIVHLIGGCELQSIRGSKQREVMQALAGAGGKLAASELEARLPGAKARLNSLAERGLVRLEVPAPSQNAGALNGTPKVMEAPYQLTVEQRAAIEAVARPIAEKHFETFLLHGVTGSGKTEVYLQLAARALAAGRNVIVMVPEIALADEVVRSFRARFGALVGIAHSAQNVSERWASWTAALSGEARIMIGPRSLIFAPIHDAGLIVVDEEHDAAYKSEEGIRYHARDLAVVLGRYARCPVVLGSATPSAESFANTRSGRYHLLRLPSRVNNRAMAAVEIIDLRLGLEQARTEKGEKKRDAIPLAPALIAALRENLAAGGQSMVFLNRRGYHNFLQCNVCGSVITCPNCSVAMTFHLRDRSLRCHYCGNRRAAPEQCLECNELGLSGQGFGTERLQAALEELMPTARIRRMDSDTSGLKGARAAILDALRAGEIDVLVGTQMITKGFDFPGVTLAAVIYADASLNLPDFRSGERTFQLLTQIAGRAGRGERPGRVIIQTYAPQHYSVSAARAQDYARFMRRELQLRKELSYPPFAKLAMVRIEGADPDAVARVATSAAHALTRAAEAYRRTASVDSIRVLGPAPAPIERIKQRWRWQVMVKSENLTALRNALSAMQASLARRARGADVYLGIDIDPVRML